MSTYAILGATGRVGGHILELLTKDHTNNLQLYARSKSKILKAHPELKDDNKVSFYEGDLQDVEVIKRCISGTKAVFLTVALSENLPGCSIAMDTAKVVIQALKKLKAESTNFRAPRLVVLSSSSVDDKWWKDIPWPVHKMLFNANCHIYTDLQNAEKLLRGSANELNMELTFVKPGGLSNDIQRGYKLDMEKQHTPMSFADLAAAMIEIAGTDGDTWNLKDVSIVPRTEGEGARLEYQIPYALSKGLVACYLPGLYMYLRGWLP